MKNAVALALMLSVSVITSGQKKYPLVSFKKLEEATADTVQLKAYVLDVYVCPPCPPGAICKPCIENHFTVVEEKPVDVMKIPLEARRRIFSDHPQELAVGKKYLLKVRFRNKKESPRDNLELISFKEL